MEHHSIAVSGGGYPEIFHRVTGPSDWASLSLTDEDWARYGLLLEGREFDAATVAPVITPPRSALERLRRLLRTARRAARETPDALQNPDVTRGLDESLIQAAVACVAGRPAAAGGGRRHHAKIIRRFAELAEANAERPLYMVDICTALNVSDRLLRQCCHEYFGMGPKHYLMLRRLQLARRALVTSVPHGETVTGIATRFGFWELGRFSVAYRARYGETPLVTLRRPPPGASGAAWEPSAVSA